MTSSVDYERRGLEFAIRRARDRGFNAGLDRESAERVFVKAVEAVGTAATDLSTATIALATFEASLCTGCGCPQTDHGIEEDPYPRAGEWVCFDCGTEAECPR